MTMASGLYVLTFQEALKNTLALDLDAATNVICLYTDTKTPDFDADAAHSATNELASTGGYTQDTKATGTATLTAVAPDRLKYTWSAAVTWSSASFTARGMIVGMVTSLEPIVAVTFGQDYTATNGNFTITPHTDGIFYIDCVPA